MDREQFVKNIKETYESIEDTIIDVINYWAILKAFLDSNKEK